ncbi:hypothetical protein HPB47_013427 [Ixodes persulcatus]|uniref:Uncharacterized protein n=1 Tax=Ixodes persulcatus TaxID=34615 RepID=A0AC60R203_IXOPE|nr:hypothetical protein HPB47_013427 [Ixodes persulcatus]
MEVTGPTIGATQQSPDLVSDIAELRRAVQDLTTTCIEVAAQEGRQRYAAFLDISKAHDTVDRNIPWSRLRGLGINGADVNLLQALYAGVSVRIEWEDHMTKRLPVPRGSDVGFDLSYRMEGVWKRQRIPALTYADDVVLLEDAPGHLQVLLDICGELATHLRLRFNQSKSAVLVWGDRDGPNQEPEEQWWYLQGGKLTKQNTVKYLGVTLAAESDYVKVHKREKRLGVIRGKGVLANKTTWTFSRFEVVRGLWKMAIVPGLTYANGVHRKQENSWREDKRDCGKNRLGSPENSTQRGCPGRPRLVVLRSQRSQRQGTDSRMGIGPTAPCAT